MPDILLGLDIGSRYIKTAVVRRGGKCRIIDAGVIRTPDGSVLDGAIIYMDAVADAVKAYIDKCGAKVTGLGVSISSPDIITRGLTLPATAADDIPAAVKFEILKFFPSIKDTHEIAQKTLAVDESGAGAGAGVGAGGVGAGASVGVGGVGGASAGGVGAAPVAVSSTAGASISALAALCPTELIKSYEELASRLGLQLRRIDIRADAQAKAAEYYCDSIDISRAGGVGAAGGGADAGARESAGAGAGTGAGVGANAGEAGGGAGLMIDIGYRSSHVSVVRSGKLVLSRYIMCGAAAYDNMIAEKAGVAREDAEKARVSGDFTGIAIDPGDSENIISMCFMEIDEQIRQAAGLYGADGALSYFTVVGEGSMIPGIDSHFEREHNLARRELAAAKKGKTGYDALIGNGNPKLLLAAAGAVLYGGDARGLDMNFAPGAAGAAGTAGAGGLRIGSSGRLAAALAAAFVIAAASVAVGVYCIAERHRIDAEIAAINAEIIQDGAIAEKTAAISQARAKLSVLNAVLDAVEANGANASELLDSLAAQAPESLFVTNFNMSDAVNAVMNGRARDYESISEFALSLRRTGKYDSVRINSIAANQTASDIANDYSFTMTVVLKGDS
jgi:Tfp pilus assembly PilM family ATPase/Tfp pilus assembly protein PilN